jgi:hypothetical protein
MRAAFLLLLLCSLSAPAADKPTAEEQAAIDYVARSGGKATIDPRLAPEARVSAKFEAISDGLLAGLKKHPKIGAIETFDATRCTEKGLAALKDFPHLRKLIFGKAALTPGGVAAIGGCTELRTLGLVNAGVTDGELAALKGLTLLEHLTLSNNPRVTDKGMSIVKEFGRLQALYLSNTSITDKGLGELKGLDALRTLHAGGTGVTADAAERFPDDMPNLRVVRR